MEEKRQTSLESISFQLGQLSGEIKATHHSIERLDEKVSVQNGRIGDLEGDMRGYKGAISLVRFFILANIPVVIFVAAQIAEWFRSG